MYIIVYILVFILSTYVYILSMDVFLIRYLGYSLMQFLLYLNISRYHVTYMRYYMVYVYILYSMCIYTIWYVYIYYMVCVYTHKHALCCLLNISIMILLVCIHVNYRLQRGQCNVRSCQFMINSSSTLACIDYLLANR